jgi:3-isopropylmalate dehydrogenase
VDAVLAGVLPSSNTTTRTSMPWPWRWSKPWTLSVLVTENMFGDILSDLAAGLIGSMEMAPSGDIGDDHGLFQPAHGTAPDIAGQDKANPCAMFLSAAMMLYRPIP